MDDQHLKTLPQVISEAIEEFQGETGKRPEELGISEHALKEKARVEAKKLSVNSGRKGRNAKRCIPPAEADILRHKLLTYFHKQSVKAGKRGLPKPESGLSSSQIEMLVIGLVNSLYPDFDWDAWKRDAEGLSSALLRMKNEAYKATQGVEGMFGPDVEEAGDELNRLTEPSPAGYIPGVGWDGETFVGSEEEIEEAEASYDHALEVEGERQKSYAEVDKEASEAAKARRLYVLELARYSKKSEAHKIRRAIGYELPYSNL